MKYAIAFLLLLAHASPGTAAQRQLGELQGVVRDPTGLPIAGVEIVLSGPAGVTTVTTTEDGVYRFQGLDGGAYQLSAVRSGFREWTRGIVLETGMQIAIDIDLRPGYAETLIVTASRSSESLMAAPVSVAVIGSQEIEASGADNFADLLRTVPGLNVMQVGARDVNVNPRGSTGILSNKMLVMVDGRSFFQPIFGAVYWDLMSVAKDEIGQIEVLRTPASAVWGANALSGVINLRTKSPREMRGFRGHLGFGERGTKTTQVSWADATPGFSYKLSGSYFEQNPWDRDNLLPDGTPMPPDVTFKNVGTEQPKFDARIDWDANPNSVWKVAGGIAGANGYIFSALGPNQFGSGSYSSYVELDHRSTEMDLKLYWNRLDAPFRVVLFGLDEDSTNDTYVVEMTRRLNRRGHAVAVGGTMRLDHFDITIAPQESSRLDLAAYAEDAIALTPMLKLIIGGRLDKFDTTEAVFAPRVGAVVTANPRHSIRVAYNRAYRAPSLLENFVDVRLPAVIPLDPPFLYYQSTMGSTDLKMEKLHAVEAGYTGLLNSRTTVSATVYHQTLTDNIRFFPVAFYGPGNPPPGWPLPSTVVPLLPRLFTFVNVGKVRDRGFELATTVEWARLSLQGTYTLQGTPALESPGVEFPLQINRPARHHGGGRFTFNAQRWTAGVDAAYVGRAYWSDVFTEPFWGYTEDYVALNGRISVRPASSALELWVSGTNLLDEKIKGHVFSDTVRRKITAGITWRVE